MKINHVPRIILEYDFILVVCNMDNNCGSVRDSLRDLNFYSKSKLTRLHEDKNVKMPQNLSFSLFTVNNFTDELYNMTELFQYYN